MWTTKNLVDMLSGPISSSYKNILFLTAFICVVSILSKILIEIREYIEKIHSEKLIHQINKNIMLDTMQTDIELYDSPEYLDTMQAIMSDSYSLSNLTWNIFYGISNVFSLIIALVMIGNYNLIYAIVLIIVSIPSAIIDKYYSKKLYNLRLDNLSAERQQSYVYSISSDRYFAYDIRLHNLTRYFIERYVKFWNVCFEGRTTIRKKQLLCMVPSYLLPQTVIIICIMIIVNGIIEGKNSVGDFTLYIGLFNSLIGAVDAVINSFSTIYEDKLKVDTVKRFGKYHKETQKSGELILQGDFDIEFKNVSFMYPKSNRYVLKDLSFRIKNGTRVCILGVNGSGKSTIIKLLLRFYDATSGEILINSINIKEYSIDSLRKAFSVIFQDYINYAFTLKENIYTSDMEKGEVEQENIEKILNTVCASELLDKLPKGIDTYIQRVFDNNGYEPSGGEQQKIALARAVNRNSKVLILDEPTASLDPESENNLLYNIKTKLVNKTIIFTSHRLSTVHLADNILFIGGGKIIEEGNHEKLMELGGQYAKLYKMQAEAYK
jgi:ABC-type multidrug transport system fused ATPase/permease subunit